MKHQEAIKVLNSLVDKHQFNTKEKEAIMTAIGILSWTSLSKSRVKALKAKRKKATEW